MRNVIKVENLSKAYQLGEIGTGTISRDLERFWARIRGNEDPFLKIGEVNDRSVKGSGDIVWSLRDLNFDIQQGDSVGIIGRNGAGKSTLLKILSRITSPTAGKIKIKGRVASLLEVGTGFHPELTGRENIYLNGAILGMLKAEIKQKFEEIVDFSGVERYIDTPVKRYSSGMYVRLAFAVAAHLESEILIVDEVLAVGDAEFQKKCLGKMGDISNKEGRTVLFVSHNMGAVTRLCNSAIILDKGKVVLKGTVNEGIKKYIEIQSANKSVRYVNVKPEAHINEITLEGPDEQVRSDFRFDETVMLRLRFKVTLFTLKANIGVKVMDNLDRTVFTTEREIKTMTNTAGDIISKITIPGKLLAAGLYKILVAIHIPNKQLIETVAEVVFFEILETETDYYKYVGADNGCVYVDCKWEIVNK